jgi:hypothetical protein
MNHQISSNKFWPDSLDLLLEFHQDIFSSLIHQILQQELLEVKEEELESRATFGRGSMLQVIQYPRPKATKKLKINL